MVSGNCGQHRKGDRRRELEDIEMWCKTRAEQRQIEPAFERI
jgi:hypothetical protein